MTVRVIIPSVSSNADSIAVFTITLATGNPRLHAGHRKFYQLVG